MTRGRDTISLSTAVAITVANMVGTGVFTSLGFQLADIRSGFPLLALWAIGGILALCGAVTYAELGAALPRSGGEYHFLGRIYGPTLGFLAGWVSLTVGFSAPIALAAMAFGRYLTQVVPFGSPLAWSLGVVLLSTAVHLRDLRLGSVFQNVFTVLKVALLGVFLTAPFVVEERTSLSFAPAPGDFQTLLQPAFGVSLLFVMYAYAGWNASTYIVEELGDPARDVPRSLLIATSVVTLAYVAVHWAFLSTTPIDAIEGKLEVGHVVAEHAFGPAGGAWLSGALSVALISTISAMTWAGPRVTMVMGQDHRWLRGLSETSERGIPRRAILLQTAIVVLLLVTSTFDDVLVYVQFTLSASLFVTVAGVFVLRRREPDLPRPYRTWLYPWTPLLFLLITAAAMVHTLLLRPLESVAGAATLSVGLALHWAFRDRSPE